MGERAIDMAELSALAAWMRDVGATSVAAGGVHLTLGPVPLCQVEPRPVPEPVGTEAARAAKAAQLRALALGLR